MHGPSARAVALRGSLRSHLRVTEMTSTISPLAPKTTPAMPAVAGVRLATAAAGIRYQGRTDVMLAVFDDGASVAGVFTRSKCPPAPVEWCRARIKGGRARALVVNSGNANAFTGKNGREACAFTAKLAADVGGCKVPEVFLGSTGVLGDAPAAPPRYRGCLSPRPASSASRCRRKLLTASWRVWSRRQPTKAMSTLPA